MRKTIIFGFIAALCVLTLTACHHEKPPDSKATAPLAGVFVTAGGSRLTFTGDGDNDWSGGDVLVELAADAEYLLEGRANNTVYRYVFGFQNKDANYDVADDFQLSTGTEWFAKCRSRYAAAGVLTLDPYSPSGDRLIFTREED